MTEPQRQDFAAMIGEINAAGVTVYKLSEMITAKGLACQFGQLTRIKRGGRTEHFLGEMIRKIHHDVCVVSRETLRT